MDRHHEAATILCHQYRHSEERIAMYAESTPGPSSDASDREVISTFTTSRGWLKKFFRCHGFTIRHHTTVSQHLPWDLVPKVVGFIIHLRRILLLENIPLSTIGNMDEKPCWMDMQGETTVELAGVRSVPLRITGHEKAHFTVVLGAMADGSKLKPFVVLKGIRPIPELSRIQGVVVADSPNGWMNEYS